MPKGSCENLRNLTPAEVMSTDMIWSEYVLRRTSFSICSLHRGPMNSRVSQGSQESQRGTKKCIDLSDFPGPEE